MLAIPKRFSLLTGTLFAVGTWLTVSGTAQGQLDFLKNLTGSATPAKPTKIIAQIEIKGKLAETPKNLPPLLGEEPPASLLDILDRLDAAKKDSEVQAVILDLQDSALGPGQIEEFTAALRKLKSANKPVFVHADSLTTWTYAAGVGASHVSMVPTGDLWLTGIYGAIPFLRGTFDKLGIVPDIERCGAYKSAAEPFMLREPSAENKEMIKWLYDGLFEGVVQILADSRGVTPEKMRGLIDRGPYTAEEALQAGLIDSVKHRQDFIADIRKKYGEDAEIVRDYGKDDESELPSDNFFAMFEFLMKMLNPAKKEFDDPTIAVVYVDGAIETGSSHPSLFDESEGAFSTTIRRALDKAAEETAVKAVVLRVDSPGGSALASEIILDAARRVAAVKPLVVSMGNVAGSGGYYVTCAADTIFADRTTITASIGVVGGKIVTAGLWDKLGVNWHPVQRGEMAAMMSTAAPFSEAERAKMRHYMESIYGVFKGHVTKARGAKLKKPIDDIAGGRVFTGAQALELGLVDRLGGLADAVAFAANKVGVSDYDVHVIPEPLSIFDLLMGDKAHEDDPYMGSHSPKRLSLSKLPVFDSMLPLLSRTDPLGLQAVLNALKRIELIHQEGAIMMMPEEITIR